MPSLFAPPAVVTCEPGDRDLTLDGALTVGEGFDGDDRQRFPLLVLDAPVCVTVVPPEGGGPVRVVASELQLDGLPIDGTRAGTSSPLRVRVVGRAAGAARPHHHTLLVVSVSSVTDGSESPFAGCAGPRCRADGEGADGSLSGEWFVEDVVPGPVSAVSAEAAEALLGRTVRVGAGIVAPWTVCGGARWRRSVWTAEAWTAAVGRPPVDDPVVSWDARCADGTQAALVPTADGGLWTTWDGAEIWLRR